MAELTGTLSGKVCVVAGTSPNIGGGIAEALAAAGGSVVCIDADPANARDAAAYLSRSGRALGLVCDVTDEEQVRQAVTKTVAEFGAVDVLVNNAAIFNRKGVLDMPLAEWRRQIDVILTGTFLFSRYAAQDMISRKQAGSIINIISTAGHQGEPRNVAYSTAKAGLLNMTRSMAMELAAQRIRVNSLTPTATDPRDGHDRAQRWGRTLAPLLPERLAAFETFRKRVPLQELPTPQDYGQAAVFLAGEASRMITGMDLRVDAGAVARYWAWDPEMPMR